MEKVKLLDDGKLIGLDEQLNSLQTSDACLLGDLQASVMTLGSTGSNGGPNKENPGTLEHEKGTVTVMGIHINYYGTEDSGGAPLRE